MKKSDLEAAVRQYRGKVESASAFTDDKTALEMIELFPLWEVGIEVTKGKRWQYNSSLYRCEQSHTTQADWAPDLIPALWTKVSLEEWPEWVQPTGVQDAYEYGAKVSHNGKHWVSTYEGANVWEPGGYGWSED